MGAIEDNAAGSAASLWVIVIQNLDITGLPGLINAMILLSGMSCGNGHLYFSVHKLTSLTPEQRQVDTIQTVKRSDSSSSALNLASPSIALPSSSLITRITLLVTVILYFGCKVWRGTKTVDPRTAADLVSGKAEVDEECKI
ncbi:AAT family amino acid transporter, partial [Metarhizium majus ARSEF 297]